jgi:hypothetical protein
MTTNLIRNERDNYATPPWCYEGLEEFIDWSKVHDVLEPCAGDNRILDWLGKHSVITFSAEIRQEKDYFEQNYFGWKKFDLIVTNPPYSLALEFVKKGIEDSICSFWLLRLNFLASQSRKSFFLANPLSALIVLSKRPSFRLTGGTDSTDYGWFVWDKANICNVRGITHI